MHVKDYIKIKDLKDGYLYKIIARNARYGIWKAETQGFIISRIKFGSNYAFEEYHYDCKAFPTAQPIEEIEKSPFDTKHLCREQDDEHFWFTNEDAVLKYLNKFENTNGRDNLKSAHENPIWLQEMINKARREKRLVRNKKERR